MSIRLDEARIRLLNINGGILPTVNNTYNLGTSSLKWANVYATTFLGNATSATNFSSERTIALTGDVTGSASSNGASGWSIDTTVGNDSHTHSYIIDNGNHTETASGTTANAPTTGMLKTSGLYMTRTYGDSNTPASYGNIINLAGSGTGLLLCEWSGSDNTSGHLYYRSHRDTSTGGWSPWLTILDSNNYTNYTVTKTGSGASGTWGINITGSSASCTGNAATATKLATARTISLIGDCSGSTTFDGSNNASINVTIADNSHNHTWLELAPGNISLPTGASMSADTGPFNVRWFSTNNLIAGQPATYGFLMTMSAGKGSMELHQLWFTQCDGDIYHRGTNGGNSDSPPSFKRLWQEGHSITGAVWNDYAEYRESDCKEFGYVLTEKGDDTLTKTTERLLPFAGVSSDTWGFCQGETEKAKTPIAVAGRVLVYTYRDRNDYKPGDVVCAAPNGTIDIMTREEVINYPDRIVGTVSCVPEYDTWGSGDRDPVKVNRRIWIKVR